MSATKTSHITISEDVVYDGGYQVSRSWRFDNIKDRARWLRHNMELFCEPEDEPSAAGDWLRDKAQYPIIEWAPRSNCGANSTNRKENA